MKLRIAGGVLVFLLVCAWGAAIYWMSGYEWTRGQALGLFVIYCPLFATVATAGYFGVTS